MFGYIDGPRFVASPTFKAVLEAIRQVQALNPGAPDVLAELNRSCGFDPLNAVREVAFTYPSGVDMTVIVALDRNADQAFPCVAALGQPKPGSVADHTAVCKEDNCVVAHQDLLVFGRRHRLEELFAAFPAPSGAPPADDYLFVTGEFPNPLGVERASISMAPASAGTRLATRGTGELPGGSNEARSGGS